MIPRLAVLDDERRMTEILEMVLRREGYQVETFERSDAALAALEKQPFDLLITDLKMPGADGLEVLRHARRLDPELPVILMTAHATVSTAVAAMREGAFDYVEKPFDNDELKTLVRRALEVTRLSRENRYLQAELRSRYSLEDVIAESPAMRDVLDLVRRAARSPSTVLISGESGTGKELIARAVHYHSDRVGRPFVAANCKAFAGGVLESELFGHEKGAFTGAHRSKPGLFERAHGGTLFLDEIGEIDADFQAKLLRVLQERRIQPVGATQERAVDVRLVAATNRDLRAEVAAGSFREDLYFRLAVIPIHIPPLRERAEDVLPLARHFLAKWSAELGRVAATNRDLRAEVATGSFREDLYFRLAVIPIHIPPLRERAEDVLPLARHFLAKWSAELGRELEGWTDEVEAYLTRNPWPGNVRELENAIERGVVLARGERIGLDDLLVDASAEESGSAAAGGLQQFLDQAASERIRTALERAGGVKVEAARQLGVDRSTLYRLMRKYGIQ